jgi:hypothetical protein
MWENVRRYWGKNYISLGQWEFLLDCTPSEAEGLHPERSRGVAPRAKPSAPRAKPRVAPRAEPSAPRAKPSTPRAEPRGGGICIEFLVSASLDEQFERTRMHPERSRGLHPERSRVHPERSRGGGCICIGFLVSASLDEQFEQSRVHPERSRGLHPNQSRGVCMLFKHSNMSAI